MITASYGAGGDGGGNRRRHPAWPGLPPAARIWVQEARHIMSWGRDAGGFPAAATGRQPCHGQGCYGVTSTTRQAATTPPAGTAIALGFVTGFSRGIPLPNRQDPPGAPRALRQYRGPPPPPGATTGLQNAARSGVFSRGPRVSSGAAAMANAAPRGRRVCGGVGPGGPPMAH